MKRLTFAPWLLTLAVVLLAATVGQTQETRRQYLSGHGKDDAVPWRFLCTAGPQSGFWTNLPVPSNWELHGFGTPRYMREPTNAIEEQGRYQCQFTVPAGWNVGRVFLVFDGVMTDTHAEVNGQTAGPDHQGGFYRFKYDITRHLNFDSTNTLDVLVHKRSANASINQAERAGDYWLFGGIYRPVYLEAVPPVYIERVAIDARADGNLTAEVFTGGLPDGSGDFSLEGRVLKPGGGAVGQSFQAVLNGERATLKTRLANPRTWNAESPNLYRLQIRLKGKGKVLHEYSQRFGFRTMEVRRGDGLYVNGRRVVLKGADRHSFWPDSGRCLSEAVHRLDIGLMREMNMNAVRMSHYPPDEQFLDLCDELGLYVLDELAGWQHNYDTASGRRLISEMVPRDVNHPCILFWDNGNEGGWNTEVDEDFKLWDPQQRPVLHPWSTHDGVNTAHYLTYDRVVAACQGLGTLKEKSGQTTPASSQAPASIYMPTEFLHGLYDGGAGAGLEDHWDLMTRSRFLGGGFIWALLDEGLKRPDTGKIDVAGNLAPDGILGPYRQKEASFYTVKATWSPITVRRLSWQASGFARLAVANHYSFTDVNQCGLHWELRQFRRPEDSAAGYVVVDEGKLRPPSIPPGTEKEVGLRPGAKEKVDRADALAVRVTDPAGRELWSWVWPLPRPRGFESYLAASSGAKVQANESGETIDLLAGDLKVRLSKQTGLLAGVERGPQAFSLLNGPRPANPNPGSTLAGLEAKADGDDFVVKATFTGAMRSVTWRLRPNGWLRCAYAYDPGDSAEFHGMQFDYPEGLVKHKKWLGDGPYRVWQNRRQGVTLNVWENDYNNTVTGWRDWIYPEFKGFFANVRWMQLETGEGRITAVPEQENEFVQVLTPEFPPAELQAKTAVKLPQAGLAFLQVIPPIGSKFHWARDTGPQGQTPKTAGLCAGAVNLFFGPSDGPTRSHSAGPGGPGAGSSNP